MKEDHDDLANQYDNGKLYGPSIDAVYLDETVGVPRHIWRNLINRPQSHITGCSGWPASFTGVMRCGCGAYTKRGELPERAWELLGGDTLKEKAAKPPIAVGVLQLFPRSMSILALLSKAGADKYGTTVSTIRFLDTPSGYDLHTDALVRHIVDEKLEGPVNHKDGGALHAAQAAWNALARLEIFLYQAEKPASPNETD